jgi:hypothetical protein
MLIVAWSGFVATAAFGQSVVLSDGGVAFPGGSEQVTAVFTGTAPLAKSGQTSCFDASGNLTLCGTGVGIGQEGHLQHGVRWPIPRFTENGDGTVTDNLTGLIWLEDADCLGPMIWQEALLWAWADVYDGSADAGGVNDDCGLEDGSVQGEWRVPTEAEFESLAYMEADNPAIPNTAGTGQWAEGDPFIDIPSGDAYFWTSTSVETGPASAYLGFPRSHATTPTGKGYAGYVWPVRDSR